MGIVEGNITHWGLLRGWESRGGTAGGKEVGITLGEMPDVSDGGMETANHHGMCVPMQQSCKICICTPELKVQ